MTEQVPPSGFDSVEADDQPSTTADPEATTGIASVDQVIGDLDGLDDLPLEEHLGAFERAHGSLRAALDAEPSDPA
jgi:hypothetical protein